MRAKRGWLYFRDFVNLISIFRFQFEWLCLLNAFAFWRKIAAQFQTFAEPAESRSRAFIACEVIARAWCGCPKVPGEMGDGD
jgi:hypothetical protein